jgi:peptide/nickel transport system permease protein
MIKFFLTRIFHIALSLLVVIIFVFFLSRLTGDPATLMLSTEATKEQVEALRASLGLDRPLTEQLYIYIKGVATRGDFGLSFRYKEPALLLVAKRGIPTAALTLFSLLIAIVIGVPSGIISGLRPGRWMDMGTQSFALLGQSAPTFWLGLMLIQVFAVALGWFPVMGGGGFSHLVLPAITLGLPTAALIGRMLRSSVLEVKSEDYVRTARAKGLPERVVIFMHIIRNALIPVVTVIMLQMGYLMGGAVVTETVFNYPGMGLLAIQSIYGRDYVVVQAFVVMAAAIIMVLNLIADLIYLILDPRLKYDH